MFIYKSEFLFKIKACEKNNHKHIVDIPRIIFEHNAEIGQKDYLRMDTNLKHDLIIKAIYFQCIFNPFTRALETLSLGILIKIINSFGDELEILIVPFVILKILKNVKVNT